MPVGQNTLFCEPTIEHLVLIANHTPDLVRDFLQFEINGLQNACRTEYVILRTNYRTFSFNSTPYSRLGNNVRDFLQFEINGLQNACRTESIILGTNYRTFSFNSKPYSRLSNNVRDLIK